MKTFVISAYPERRGKYNEDYEIIDAIWWEDITDEILNKYHFRYKVICTFYVHIFSFLRVS